MSVEAGGTWSYKIGFCDNQVGLARRDPEQSLFQGSGNQEASLGQETSGNKCSGRRSVRMKTSQLPPQNPQLRISKGSR